MRKGKITIENVLQARKINAGFTLIELLITIAIIGILSAGVMTLLNPIAEMQKGQDAKRKADLAQVQRLLELYYNDNERYPASLNFGAVWSPYTGTGKLPQDPKAGKNYDYISAYGGQAYYLYASLDRGGNDPQACFSNGNKCTNATNGGCGAGKICNYGTSSPNVSP